MHNSIVRVVSIFTVGELGFFSNDLNRLLCWELGSWRTRNESSNYELTHGCEVRSMTAQIENKLLFFKNIILRAILRALYVIINESHCWRRRANIKI